MVTLCTALSPSGMVTLRAPSVTIPHGHPPCAIGHHPAWSPSPTPANMTLLPANNPATNHPYVGAGGVTLRHHGTLPREHRRRSEPPWGEAPWGVRSPA